MLRLAFIGFRHSHVLDLYGRAQEADDVDVVAACEEHAETAARLVSGGLVDVTHTDFRAMLDEVDCDAVAVGDAYGRRGERAIVALQHGKHVLSDKPLCTRLEELAEIEALTKSTGLRVGCMLTMRDTAQMIALRQLVRGGKLGDVQAIGFGGQHPLLRGVRPSWYFEPGQHGGTINDIGIHMIDAIPWITSLRFTRVEAARCWNARVDDAPHFQEAGQMMLTLENGCGVLGDVSYLMPRGIGYKAPFYWRTTIWGERGMAETSLVQDHVHVALENDAELRSVALPKGRPGGYLRAFLRDVRGVSADDDLKTVDVLEAARCALKVQWAADSGVKDVSLQR